MKLGNGIKNTLLGLLGLSLSACALQKEPVRQIKSCQSTAALAAFQTTAYALVTRNCTTCHGSNRTPFFASPTLRRAYEQALTVVNLDNPERSRIVQKVNDGHCGSNCESRGNEMISAIQSWKAAQGESTQSQCTSTGDTVPADASKNAPVATESFSNPRMVRTVALTIPATIPVSQGLADANFTTLDIPLGNGLEGTIKIEIQKYSIRDTVDSGSYRFRRPRLYIAPTKSAIEVRDMGISINEASTSVFTTYHGIDTPAAPTAGTDLAPLLSPLVTDPIPQLRATGDQIILSFTVARTTAVVACKNVAGFQSLVFAPAAGLAITRNCTGCHNGTIARAPRYTQAAGETVGDVCKRLLQRITRPTPEQSALIRNPGTGANGHTVVAGDYAKFIEWIESERD